MQQNINPLKAIFLFFSSLAHISIMDSEITSFQFFTGNHSGKSSVAMVNDLIFIYSLPVEEIVLDHFNIQFTSFRM